MKRHILTIFLFFCSALHCGKNQVYKIIAVYGEKKETRISTNSYLNKNIKQLLKKFWGGKEPFSNQDNLKNLFKPLDTDTVWKQVPIDVDNKNILSYIKIEKFKNKQ